LDVKESASKKEKGDFDPSYKDKEEEKHQQNDKRHP